MTDSSAPEGPAPLGVIDYGRTASGTTQLRRQWRATGDARAVIVLVHGISEHTGRYEHVGARFSRAGFHTVGFDHRGHGGSDGPRTYVSAFADFLDDVQAHIEVARRTGLPVVLLGHSMGGLISTAYAAATDRPQADLVVLSAPALGANVPGWQRALAPRLAQLAPKFFVPQPDFDPAVLSRDPAVQQAYRDDPMIRSGASANLGAEMLRTMDELPATLDNIAVPTLVLHGADDDLVPASASEPLEGVAAVERRVLPGLRHEIFNEPEGPEVLDTVVAWIDERLPTAV